MAPAPWRPHGRPNPPRPAGDPEPAKRSYLRTPAFWALGFAFAALAFNHGAVLNHIRPLLDDRGVAEGAAVLAASMIGPMQVAGRLFLMMLERRLANAAVTAYCFLGLCLAPVALMAAGGAPAALAVFVLLQGSAWGLTSIMKPVITRDIMGQRDFGAINGALALPFLVAMALAPVAGALLWSWGGYTLMLWTVAVAAFAGFLGFLAALKLHARASSGA